MALQQTSYRGCLLGMAVGDAMGYTIDSRSLAEIREDYGPNGLLGYDLVNGYADVTSNTQLAAFTCNGLLFGLTRGQMTGKMAPLSSISPCPAASGQHPSGPGAGLPGTIPGCPGGRRSAAGTAWTPGCWRPWAAVT